MKCTVAATIGPMTVGAMIALSAWIGATAWQIPTGSTSRLPVPSPLPSSSPGPQLVMLVTMTPETTETIVPTRTVIATSTPVPECGEQAIRGLACVEPHPTKTPAVWTPISTWPGHDFATPGVRYLYTGES